MKYFYLLIISVLFVSCKNNIETSGVLPQTKTQRKTLKYAEGFSITNYGDYKILQIKNPWKNADKTYSYVLINKENTAKNTFNTANFDGIINTPINKVITTSTTHIPALELLETENSIIGFPGTKYVSSKKTRALIDSGKIIEIGKNESLNTERILELQPDAIVAFGVDGASKSLNTIKNANIPIIYNGDWVEKSPLAKAEWIKFFGALYNKERMADSIFNTIETNYLKVKKLAQTVKNKPTVLSGAMYKDVWYLPSGASTEAQILKDANVNYLWSETTEKGSLALNFESVFVRGKEADIWISPSYYTSLKSLEEGNFHYTKFDAFKNKKIFSFSNTTGETGGVTYYELGIARPDLVLKDIIKICHPELLKDYNTTFFKSLN
ncbi:ABC transporter substrate-binding protein [Aurantibacter sp.]|uniref:ABC transporter substrate-binding protein n=1 Tax=Aurantibacter sp. TaxID=2807103 RepID=UPI0035C799B1